MLGEIAHHECEKESIGWRPGQTAQHHQNTHELTFSSVLLDVQHCRNRRMDPRCADQPWTNHFPLWLREYSNWTLLVALLH